ncbi:Na+/H+ antiporter NhaC [Fusobacterium nucleatum subsp. nucleatum ATCC 25586]|uniref:NA+/H+ antiporter NhaC n=2 Tax=Fusobacterium nucleatum subsp. nucleatum TaxID=76856 RepID=Q8RFP1_FUSNN|nr:Na+/H+ antiporter NhaC [Fusobacterium nucleatum]AAL94846.1 NA+/H+ antiporter NHAC [Fusobacterium nucleatum subsp. nucleatum ATCC 25586]AVQ15061.1 Na+/H+ antiporter NhaC [Fusobacterium nucleatum subsp. nucleatum ATCC 25586]KUL98441.1 sodium:proton antiporter [Fusobacterium nucleatum subsp. nucleatum]MCG6843312.1 Na+/H+ antiporter NhaC [Fusobacterium nucleatum]WMS29946.1 Na+/H+ antiporter NhaC [Fusobacterium nucleatum]
MQNQGNVKQPSLWLCLSIVLFLIVSFLLQLIIKGEPDVHMTLFFASIFASAMLIIFNKTKFSLIEEGIIHGCKIATISMMILMFIGVMIPAWIAAGTIPTLIYYGLKLISPSIFLVTATLTCAIATLCTGTSWGTAATFGVALMGIGGGLGISPGMTAAAVICGAIFGDKMSPISDTVNLSAGTCEVNIFDNIKSVATATIPGFILTIVVFIFLDLKFNSGEIHSQAVDNMLAILSNNFNLTPIHALVSLIPMILVLILALKKINALATIVVSAIVAMFIAILLQKYSLIDMMSYMNYGFKIDTGNFDVDKLLNRGGLQSMMWTVSIGYLGLSYGGILEKTGVLNTLLNSMQTITKNSRNLILSHIVTGFLTIMLSASPYVSILIPGRMFIKGYEKLGIKKSVASRTCEHSGICLDPLLPWSLGAVYFSGVLGVKTMDYAIYCILLYVVPLIATFYAITGIFVWKENSKEGVND